MNSLATTENCNNYRSQNDRVLQPIKNAGIPVLVSMGDADEAVPVANVRTWVETMKEMQMKYDTRSIPE